MPSTPRNLVGSYIRYQLSQIVRSALVGDWATVRRRWDYLGKLVFVMRLARARQRTIDLDRG